MRYDTNPRKIEFARIYVNTQSKTISSDINGDVVEHMTYLNKCDIPLCVDEVAVRCEFGTSYQLRWID